MALLFFSNILWAWPARARGIALPARLPPCSAPCSLVCVGGIVPQYNRPRARLNPQLHVRSDPPPKVPVRTIKSWLTRAGKRRYSTPANDAVDALVERVRKSQHLRSGVEATKSWIAGNLKIRLSRKLVSESMARVAPPEDPLEQEVKELKVYHNRGPWACLHSDGNHKVRMCALVRGGRGGLRQHTNYTTCCAAVRPKQPVQLGPFGFVIYMFVDGYSRFVLSARVTAYDGAR